MVLVWLVESSRLEEHQTYLVGAVREVHSDHVETRWSMLALWPVMQIGSSPTLSQHGDLLSTIGLWTCIVLGLPPPHWCSLLTDSADDARSAVVSFGSIVDVETGVPLHLGPIVQVVQSVTHS